MYLSSIFWGQINTPLLHSLLCSEVVFIVKSPCSCLAATTPYEPREKREGWAEVIRGEIRWEEIHKQRPLS